MTNDAPTAHLSQAQEAGLKVVEKLAGIQAAFDELNRAAKDLFGPDFYPHQKPIADCILGDIIDMLDAALDGMATYFLYEMPRAGGSVGIKGRTWPIKTVADIRQYLLDTQADRNAG